jgi:hypothetical protein
VNDTGLVDYIDWAGERHFTVKEIEMIALTVEIGLIDV